MKVFSIKARLPSFGCLSGEQRQMRDVVATLALSLCRLRGVPLLNDRDLDALMRMPVIQDNAEAPTTREDRIDQLIRQLDRLILARVCR